jgi:hypothetical protein
MTPGSFQQHVAIPFAGLLSQKRSGQSCSKQKAGAMQTQGSQKVGYKWLRKLGTLMR